MRRYFISGFAMLLLWGCASTQQSTSTRRHPNLITAEEIAGSTAKDAVEAINLLRPQWLTSRGASSATNVRLAIYLNNMRMESSELLRNVAAASISEIRYMSSSEATTYFGTGNMEGAIVIKTK